VRDAPRLRRALVCVSLPSGCGWARADCLVAPSTAPEGWRCAPRTLAPGVVGFDFVVSEREGKRAPIVHDTQREDGFVAKA
jgi:hypothetical protein